MRLGGIEPSSLVPKTSTLSVELQTRILQVSGIIVANMQTIDEQIKEIEAVLRKTPHHKATNGFIGAMRAKIARLKDKEIESASLRQGSGGRAAFAVRKQGDATIVLIGPPSAGKSTLINRLTNTESKVAPYAFTTVTVVPGMLKYKEAYIQILDIPGLIEGAREGKGRGKEVLSVARAADLLVVMTDVERIERIPKMVAELEGAGIRINETRPDIAVEKKIEGGLEIKSNIKQDLDKDAIKKIAREYGINNCVITLNEKVSFERLFDSFSQNRVYVPALFVINKVDTDKGRTLSSMPEKGSTLSAISISAEKGTGIDKLINEIWKTLKFVTVYLVKPDQDPNFDNPIVMKSGDTLRDVALKIGTDFAENKKLVKIWGAGAKFPGQEVSFSTKVEEGMQIRFI